MASALSSTPQFEFIWSENTAPALSWNKLDFNRFTSDLGSDWKELTFSLTVADSTKKTFRIEPLIDNTQTDNHLSVIKFHNSDEPDKQIKELFFSDSNIQKYVASQVEEYDTPLPTQVEYETAFKVSDIWPHVTGKKPLIVFDFDFTLICDYTEYEAEACEYDIALIEEDLNEQLTKGKTLHPEMKYVLITNTHESYFESKFALTDIDASLFEALKPMKKCLRKAPRLNEFLLNSKYTFDQIIIVDDNESDLEGLAKMCALHNIPVVKLQFFGGMDDKIAHLAKTNDSTKQLSEVDQLAKFTESSPYYKGLLDYFYENQPQTDTDEA
ncbi:hypothetical protein SOPP22_15495 [Shewanella sp. OPT22]|nr:hypothetical protein SOPP22_15495 [Shewanella sp. OPT22]